MVSRRLSTNLSNSIQNLQKNKYTPSVNMINYYQVERICNIIAS